VHDFMIDKYQLSLMDPRDGIVLQTELDVEHRSSEVLSTWLTDDGPVYHALSVHLSRAELINTFRRSRYAVAKFSGNLGQSSRR